MISDASTWVDVDGYSWSKSSVVTESNGTYVLNYGSISTSIELSGKQITDQFGYIFTVSNVTNDTENYLEITYYDEQGSLLDAKLTYMKILENGKTYTEIKAPIKTYKIEIRFRGNFTILPSQIYAVNGSATVDVASTENTGVVRPTSTSAISVVANDQIDSNGNVIAKAGDIDIKLGTGIEKEADGKLSIASGTVTRSGWTSLETYIDGFSINGEYGFQYLANGNLLNVNTGKTITYTAYADSILAHFTLPAGGATNAN